jgi:hypothetical protein
MQADQRGSSGPVGVGRLNRYLGRAGERSRACEHGQTFRRSCQYESALVIEGHMIRIRISAKSAAANRKLVELRDDGRNYRRLRAC